MEPRLAYKAVLVMNHEEANDNDILGVQPGSFMRAPVTCECVGVEDQRMISVLLVDEGDEDKGAIRHCYYYCHDCRQSMIDRFESCPNIKVLEHYTLEKP